MVIRDWAIARWNQWITKRIPRTHVITLNQRQLFVFPTRSGIGLLGLLLVLLLIAINYENNLVYGLVFLLATILVITVHLTFANVYRISISGLRNDAVFAGKSGAVALKIEAGSYPRYDIAFISSDSSRALANIHPTESISVALPVTPDKRGLFSLGRVRVETDYPFGLIKCWSWVDVSEPLWVYPTPLTPPALMKPDTMSTCSSSPAPSQMGDDLFALNTYRPGDPIKHIHWPSVARGSEPQVTVMADQSSDSSLTIDFEDYPGIELETRLSWLCARILEASREHCHYSLILPSQTLGPNSGQRHRDEALMMLARFNQWSEQVTSDGE